MTSRETTIPTLYFVVPCYNEEEVLPLTALDLVDKLEALMNAGTVSAQSKVLFVDDGSTDGTWSLICQVAAAYSVVEGISLAQNYGQQLALYAGMLEVKERCDIAITLDADGQEDLSAVNAMLEAYARGNDIVYGVRKNRNVDSLFKCASASAYYRVLGLLGTKTVKGHADYRLVSAQAIRLLEALPKRAVFLRGNFPKLSLQSTTVEFDRKQRQAGKSKYSLGKMLLLAANGLASNGMTKKQKQAAVPMPMVVNRAGKEYL